MAPMRLKEYGDAQLETGLLRTHEQEKIPFIPTGLEQSRTGPTYCQPEPNESRKMSSHRRMVIIVMLSVLLGFGVALAKDPSFPSSCMGWTRANENIHTKAARSFLEKRADASVTNATTPGAPTEKSESGTGQEQPTTPTTSATPISSSHESTTPAPSSTISHSSIPSPTSTPDTSTPSPSITSPASPTSSTFPSPTPASTSTTSQAPESTPSEASSSETASTSSKIQKTITTGRVATTSPVRQTYTTTLPDGGALTVTSTSWVAIVPTDKSTSNGGPQLQNHAPKAHGHFTPVIAAGALAVGMLLI
ncbi:hypothetical protein MAC_08935 [Metarhizium acridum CQMa 102]|uniref:Uncharacterized protein n=1 Tax=Metarhizium acridum (strain CQMa 102) TaxID=655827 RepID=E9EGD7_METAQ|nr:uncharacterized protein MAC_08935 [Metarhizium acridum CQMa 102]EFY85003.1 hypothetical protein MAC_08935 [Metarhizium acridum CQMa 102]